MTKIVTLLLFLTSSALAFAKIDGPASAKILYPTIAEEQAFVAKFFEIVELHKNSDPLLEGHGPSIREYSLDKIKFAFMVNDKADKIDLVFFNWNLPTVPGLELHQVLSQLYGSPVYILKGVEKKSVASQGDKLDQLTNFSYLLGARYMETQIKLSNPEYQVPEEFKNWKPHSEYMDNSHPLRKTLDTQVLVLLSPKKELYFEHAGATAETRPYFEAMFNQNGVYYNTIMGMMVHEIYHVKEGEDNVNGLADRREIPENRNALIAQLKSDTYLKNLFVTYAKIVFSIGDALKNHTAPSGETEKLDELKAVITEIKSKYPNAWSFIWAYEYKEGFAEYVSAYSMIQSDITTFAQQIDLQKNDENNFAYRTGAIGGLYLAYRFKKMPFNNSEDHSYGLWELILDKVMTNQSPLNIQAIIAKYGNSQFDDEQEIANIIEYLVSTVTEN